MDEDETWSYIHILRYHHKVTTHTYILNIFIPENLKKKTLSVLSSLAFVWFHSLTLTSLTHTHSLSHTLALLRLTLFIFSRISIFNNQAGTKRHFVTIHTSHADWCRYTKPREPFFPPIIMIMIMIMSTNQSKAFLVLFVPMCMEISAHFLSLPNLEKPLPFIDKWCVITIYIFISL